MTFSKTQHHQKKRVSVQRAQKNLNKSTVVKPCKAQNPKQNKIPEKKKKKKKKLRNPKQKKGENKTGG